MVSDENTIFSDQRLIDSFKKMQEVGTFANRPHAIRGNNSHMVISRRRPDAFQAVEAQKVSTTK